MQKEINSNIYYKSGLFYAKHKAIRLYYHIEDIKYDWEFLAQAWEGELLMRKSL